MLGAKTEDGALRLGIEGKETFIRRRTRSKVSTILALILPR